MANAHAQAGLEVMCFGIGLRSRFLDTLVMEAISAHGIETVLSIGAGLDTRPWRLDLPATLRWVEVDFPAMLEYKNAIMASTVPKCRREFLAADVSEPSGRERVWAAAANGPSMMITEGLLMYLPAAAVEALAATTAVGYWMLDVASLGMAQRVRMDTYQSIENVRAADHLDSVRIIDAVHRHGWTGLRMLRYASDDVMEFAAERIAAMFRNRPAVEIPEPMAANDPSGVHLFGRQSG
jgi:methyltransferase (TIGR00027 family)